MIIERLKGKNLILASGSPRRKHFFEELGLEFEIRLKDVEENYPLHLQAAEITDYLSKLKAGPFISDLTKNDILVTADTIVWLNGKAIGKPSNKQEAVEILELLSNKTHEVISSFCLSTLEKQLVKSDTTIVKFKKLTPSEITYYVNKYQPFDKAGSYGIQEWIGYIGIEKIEGSFFNVMGFPVHLFYKTLLDF